MTPGTLHSLIAWEVDLGFFVSSGAALSGDTKHGLFLFFVPTSRLQYEWINSWIYERFRDLARRLGPEAVIVAPSEGSEYRDLGSEVDRAGRAFPFDILESEFPFLVVSHSPEALVSGDETSALAINLAAFDDKEALARLFDELILASRSGVRDVRRIHLTVPMKDLTGEYNTDQGNWDFAFEEALELKPNLFGLGLNINAVAKWFRKWRARRAKERQVLGHEGL